MKKKSNTNSRYTNWDMTKYFWNLEYLEKSFNIDKYMNGGYDDDYKDNPKYVPSTLEMPDYTKIII